MVKTYKQFLDESGWRYVGLGTGLTVGGLGGGAAGSAVAGTIGLGGYQAGLERDVANAKKKAEEAHKKFGHNHSETSKTMKSYKKFIEEGKTWRGLWVLSHYGAKDKNINDDNAKPTHTSVTRITPSGRETPHKRKSLKIATRKKN